MHACFDLESHGLAQWDLNPRNLLLDIGGEFEQTVKASVINTVVNTVDESNITDNEQQQIESPAGVLE